jgi:hypothetical protein
MAWWNLDALDLDDALNADIWSTSPSLQRQIQASAAPSEGTVGAAQSWLGPPLSWVPDLVGKRWREPGAVLVMGSSYADFFTRWCGRSGRMTEHVYRAADTARTFQTAYLRSVVVGDSAYYEPIADLFRRSAVSMDCVVVTDLCRASFVQLVQGRRGLSTYAGEDVLRGNERLFGQYRDANRSWHTSRLDAGGFRVIVALGDFAASGVSDWLQREGWASEWTTAGERFRSRSGRFVSLVRAPHPANRRSKPVDMADSLRQLLSPESALQDSQQQLPRPVLAQVRPPTAGPLVRAANEGSTGGAALRAELERGRQNAADAKEIAALRAELAALRGAPSVIDTPTADARPAVSSVRPTSPFGSQRDAMRHALSQARGQGSVAVRLYVELETKGLVRRDRNRSGLSRDEYAWALLRDGQRKGWLRS